MFRDVVGPGSGLIHEPIKHLRSGVVIPIIAPKVSAYHAARASTAIKCTELIEVSTYSSGYNGTSNVQCVYVSLICHQRSHRIFRQRQIPWDAVLPGSLVEIEFHIRVAPLVNQGENRVRYELCSICVIDDTAFRM